MEQEQVEEVEESTDLVAERDQVIAWRNWRMSSYEELGEKYVDMK